MRVVVGKIEGVQSVKVSLKEGVATIQLAPSNRVTVERIRDAIRSNGFTAREADVRIAGTLRPLGDSLTLVVPGSDDVFLLEDAPGAASPFHELRRREAGARVLVAGRIPNLGARRVSGPMRLLVLSLPTP